MHDPKMTTDTFIEKAKLVHGDKYEYTESTYKNKKTKIKIICKVHGVFEQTPRWHLEGAGCQKCSLIENGKKLVHKKSLEFITKSTLKYNGKYDYSLAVYKRSDNKIKIVCPIHGIFKQTPSSHLSAKLGCTKCGKEESAVYQNLKEYKDRDGILYIINMFNKEESFIKVGITTLSVYSRFKRSYKLPYKYWVLKEVKGDLESVINLERFILNNNNLKKYKPMKKFKGRSECFELSELEIVKKQIKNFLHVNT